MFIKGKLVSLRALEPSDGSLLYQWENNMQLWPLSFTQIPFSKFILEEFVNTAHNDIYTNKQLRLMVTSLQNNQTIGIIDLFDFEPQHLRAGIGIYIQEDHQKQGYAEDSIQLIKEYCFHTLILKQIFVHVGVNNQASIALFDKTGFERVGLKKCWNRIGLNAFEDVWFMQCISERD